jgi:hypothetical protein
VVRFIVVLGALALPIVFLFAFARGTPLEGAVQSLTTSPDIGTMALASIGLLAIGLAFRNRGIR